MTLVRTIYASTRTPGSTLADVENIIEVARTNNAKNSITGLLCFNAGYYLQCLEGDRAEVNATYNRIVSDSRHSEVVILGYAEIAEREFSDWAMGFVPESSLTRDLLIKYGSVARFEPYRMNAESALKFARALAERIRGL